MGPLRYKSKLLTAYLIYIIDQVNQAIGYEQYKVITPENENDRGTQVSIIASGNAKGVFENWLLIMYWAIGESQM